MAEYDANQETTDKYSLRGRVFNRIRDDILSGRLKENVELRETTISEELGVSRTPVREALRQLELEGLVKIIPNKGAYVTGISSTDVGDIYEIRSLLEGLCARWATTRISSDKLDEMEEIILLSEFHLSKNHFDQLIDLDNRFHQLLYESCESKMLIHLLTDFHRYVQRQRSQTLSDYERSKQSIAEHKSIMEAMRAGDSALAEKLADEHINSAYKNMIKCGLSSVKD